MVNSPEPGAKIPVVRLSLDDGAWLELPNNAGRRIVLWYYPKADTPG